MSASKSKAPLRRVRVGQNLYQRGRVFTLIADVQGRQICERLDAANLTEAKQLRNARMAELQGMRESPVDRVSRRSVLFSELAAEWVELEEKGLGKLKPSTIALRKLLLNTHAIPLIGTRRVVSIEASDIRRMIRDLQAKGLSGSSVRGIFASVSCVLEYAAAENIVPFNVCPHARKSLPSKKRLTEPRYLAEDEVQALFAALGDEFRPVAQVLYFAGLRVSEALALRWKDVDLDRSLIYVREGKTAASERPIEPLPELIAVLKAHRERALSLGQHRPEALLFQTATGAPQLRRNVLRAVNNASTKAKLDRDVETILGHVVSVKVGCHDLRHSLASLAYDRGLSDVEVARLLRHSSPAVTNAIYAGMSGTAEDQAHAVAAKLAAKN